MQSIKQVLMERDGMTEDEALDLIFCAKEDLQEKLELGESADDICNEWFNLEPDYIFDLLD